VGDTLNPGRPPSRIDGGVPRVARAFGTRRVGTLKVNVTPPLDVNDPEVEQAMKVVEQLTPAQRDELVRTAYRYVYAYRRTRDPNLLIELVNSAIGAVVLHDDPEYARAVDEHRATKESSSGEPPIDVRELLAAERARRVG
jgi:hypothetical protein